MDTTTLNRAAADFTLLAVENQEALVGLVGNPDWQVDLTEGVLHLGRPFRIALLGSAADGPGTFLWGWANPGQDQTGPALAPLAQVRGRAQDLGIEALAEPEIPLAQLNDMGWRPGAAAAILGAGLLGANGLYCGPYDGGCVWLALLDAPAVRPNPVTFPRLLAQSLEMTGTSPTDDGVRHRSMLQLWAHRRGLAMADTADGLDIRFPAGSVLHCRFDQAGRVNGVNAELQGGDVPPPLPHAQD